MRLSGIGVFARASVPFDPTAASPVQGAPQVRGALSFAAFCGFVLLGPPAFAQIQGYGVAATGGTGKPVCTVTNTSATGKGNFSDCARQGNVFVQFDGPGPFTTDAGQTYVQSNTTIDGCANGQNGVTLYQPADTHRAVVIEGPASNVVIRCIRFQGTGKVPPNDFNEHDLLALDGSDGIVSQVAVDRCTFIKSSDGGLDIVGNVQDVTVQRSLFYDNPLAQLIKYNSRRRISIHHSVYTANAERNPQIKGDARNFDFVSNVVYNNLPLFDPESGANFSPYGTRLWNGNSNSDSPGNVTGNFRSNAWIDPHGELEILTDPGASAAGIYLADNYCKPGPCPASPASAPLAVPAANVITPTAPAFMRTQMLPTVGSPNRTALDQTRIDEVAAALPLVCTPVTPRQVSISNQSVNEGNSGATLMIFAATLSGPSTCPFTVSYATGNGTATAGTDYDPAIGVLIFPVGSTSQTVTVSVRGDRVFESDENFVVNLADPSGGTIGDGQAVGTIVNDDATGFSVNDVSVVEPVSGTTTASFTVTLSPVQGSATSVAYATANGTATAPADYAAKSGTLSFAAGASTQPVSIVVNADSLKEAVETFTVNLSNPTGGATVASPSGTGSVYDKGAFFTLPPCRLIDTRGATGGAGLGGPALDANTTRSFSLAGGACGVPVTARAVALNVTVTGATRAGNLRLFAAGAALPLASTINYGPHQTRANNLVVNVNASVQLAVRCDQASGTVHLIVDVAGYVL